MTVTPDAGSLGIRAVSELTGLSVDALRWYEREGLVPLVDRGADGRRRYPAAAIRFLRLVTALRRTGMPVAQVREFVQMGTGRTWHEQRMALLVQRRAAVRAQQEELADDLAVVDAKIEHYRDLIDRGLDCEDEIRDGAVLPVDVSVGG
ncbi:MerR family transcriptional regulator [Pseudonocardia sp. MH-G8]|uniref:MerR family transcriptional regulator n=1 Tax=Pseudonocardia sp. MH-G8 TaxID=1854588 RepID=UPI000B9F9BD6|nr:MerR family transcriptional regulator [Pseudonocardia sp. MH-G8]OZM78517.1 MerR family transcriptional regulator [Pseudonocardia sp. MH-G8]